MLQLSQLCTFPCLSSPGGVSSRLPQCQEAVCDPGLQSFENPGPGEASPSGAQRAPVSPFTFRVAAAPPPPAAAAAALRTLLQSLPELWARGWYFLPGLLALL